VGTAVVAGTAGAVHHHQAKKWAREDYEDQAMAQQQTEPQYQEQSAPPPQQYAPPPAGNDMTSQINQLAQMHASGVLTDEEFAAAKAKLLAG
jgi:hypothetical protein